MRIFLYFCFTLALFTNPQGILVSNPTQFAELEWPPEFQLGWRSGVDRDSNILLVRHRIKKKVLHSVKISGRIIAWGNWYTRPLEMVYVLSTGPAAGSGNWDLTTLFHKNNKFISHKIEVAAHSQIADIDGDRINELLDFFPHTTKIYWNSCAYSLPFPNLYEKRHPPRIFAFNTNTFIFEEKTWDLRYRKFIVSRLQNIEYELARHKGLVLFSKPNYSSNDTFWLLQYAHYYQLNHSLAMSFRARQFLLSQNTRILPESGHCAPGSWVIGTPIKLVDFLSEATFE